MMIINESEMDYDLVSFLEFKYYGVQMSFALSLTRDQILPHL